jgi:hypothetical protein
VMGIGEHCETRNRNTNGAVATCCQHTCPQQQCNEIWQHCFAVTSRISSGRTFLGQSCNAPSYVTCVVNVSFRRHVTARSHWRQRMSPLLIISRNVTFAAPSDDWALLNWSCAQWHFICTGFTLREATQTFKKKCIQRSWVRDAMR